MELVIDDREKAIIPIIAAIAEEYHVAYKIMRCSAGDYTIMFNGQILMIIERKTWIDLGASMTDGRKSNIEKLLAVRNATGCSIAYLIEGNPCPSFDTKFSRIPLKALRSHLDHIAIRDGIHILYAKDASYTGERLLELCVNLSSLGFIAKNKGAGLKLAYSKYLEPSQHIAVEEPNKLQTQQLPQPTNVTKLATTTNVTKLATTTNVTKLAPIAKLAAIAHTTKPKARCVIIKGKKVDLPNTENIIGKKEDFDEEILSEKPAEKIKTIKYDNSQTDNLTNNNLPMINDNSSIINDNLPINNDLPLNEIDILMKPIPLEKVPYHEAMLRQIPQVGSMISGILASNGARLRDIIDNSITINDIAAYRYDTGAFIGLTRAGRIVNSTIKTFSGEKNARQVTALATIPLISKDTANLILNKYSFNELMFSVTIEELADLKKSKNKRLGEAAAKNIIMYLQ